MSEELFAAPAKNGGIFTLIRTQLPRPAAGFARRGVDSSKPTPMRAEGLLAVTARDGSPVGIVRGAAALQIRLSELQHRGRVPRE